MPGVHQRCLHLTQHLGTLHAEDLNTAITVTAHIYAASITTNDVAYVFDAALVKRKVTEISRSGPIWPYSTPPRA